MTDSRWPNARARALRSTAAARQQHGLQHGSSTEAAWAVARQQYGICVGDIADNSRFARQRTRTLRHN